MSELSDDRLAAEIEKARTEAKREVLAELRERGEGTARRLRDAIHKTEGSPGDAAFVTHTSGKVEGVRLVLGYIDEAEKALRLEVESK